MCYFMIKLKKSCNKGMTCKTICFDYFIYIYINYTQKQLAPVKLSS